MPAWPAPSGLQIDRAVRAAVTVAHRLGVYRGGASQRPQVLHVGSNVIVRLAPAPITARVTWRTGVVRPNPSVNLAREVSVARFLAERGAAVVAPAVHAPTGPHAEDGQWITLWEFREHDPAADIGTADLAASLRALHAVLAAYPGDLPVLFPAVAEVDSLLGPQRAHLALSDGDVEWLRRAHLRVTAELVERMAGEPRSPADVVQPLHGDAHQMNILVTADGLVWNDFEDTCRGPLGFDLACALRSQDDESSMRELLRAYDDELDPADVETYRRARAVQATVWRAVHAGRDGTQWGLVQRRLATLRAALGTP